MLAIFTLALDAEPWIEKHLHVFQQLTVPWQWVIAHGAAMNGGSTKWCQPQNPRLSTDGTTEYLHGIDDERVTVLEKKSWPSKDAQCNAALEVITKSVSNSSGLAVPSVLMQVDSDEMWSAKQIETIVRTFAERPQLSSMMFDCRYYVGENLITQGENCFGSRENEWLRAWRYEPGRRFISHEPPVLEGDDPERRMSKRETREIVGRFEHFAYVTEAQVAFKEKFYGYKGAVRQSQALQAYEKFPVELSRFFPFVSGSEPVVVKI